jgi:hypothetical protein
MKHWVIEMTWHLESNIEYNDENDRLSLKKVNTVKN